MKNRIKLISTGFHLPYNPALVNRAKELRKNMTSAERKLWHEYLRYSFYRFLRQRPIDNFIVDFYCPKLRLIIEVDGDTHLNDKEEEIEYDKKRTEILTGYGLKVIRFWNNEVYDDLEGVCKKIKEVIKNLIPPNPL